MKTTREMFQNFLKEQLMSIPTILLNTNLCSFVKLQTLFHIKLLNIKKTLLKPPIYNSYSKMYSDLDNI